MEAGSLRNVGAFERLIALEDFVSLVAARGTYMGI